MGAGKSTAGRRLAERLRVTFVELDRLIEQREGLSVVEIFARRGEAHFREAEMAALSSLHPTDPLILAAGGGVVLRVENRLRLKQLGFVVWMKTSPEAALARLDPATRPLLADAADPLAALQQIARDRAPFYAEIADAVVNADRPLDAVIHELQRLWDAR
jgi:shikimate kinase